jgi:ATP-binding protein involved in chromosome partitioning
MLRGVVDPELGSDIVDLGMVRSADVDEAGKVVVTIALTTAGCPLRAQIQRDIKTRVASLEGVSGVDLQWVEMTADERTTAMAKARWNIAQRPEETSVPPSTKVILVASGKGGVGKSSVTVNLAAALADRGLTVGVVDADIWGFSVPRMLGVDGRLAGVTHGDRRYMIPHERRIGAGRVRVVSMGFLVDGEETALMWRGLMLNRGVQHFLQDVWWGDDLDYLLVDMPPGTGDVQMGVAKLLPRSEVVVVTTPALAAQKVAERAAGMARKSFLRVAGVIENMSAFRCEHGTEYALFGQGGGQQLAHDAGVPLLGSVPLEPAVSAGGDEGRPVVLGESPAAAAFRAIADRLVEEAVPPADMAGCSARMFDAMNAALDRADV